MTDYELCRVSAWTLLQLRRSVLSREYADEREAALWANAALLAESLRQDGAAVFRDAEAVLRAFGAREINDWIERYAALDGAEQAEYTGGRNDSFDEARYARMTGGA